MNMLSFKLRCYNKSLAQQTKISESEARSPSHRFTGLSEQNKTTIEHFSLESTRKTPCVARDVCTLLKSHTATHRSGGEKEHPLSPEFNIITWLSLT